MCGRYTLIAKAEKIKERFNVDVPQKIEPRFNAAPTQLMPVITNTSPSGISFFYWGLIPEWAKEKSISAKLFNARSETLNEKRTFKNALKTSRCLIPADGFYEWKALGKKTKIPYRITLKDEELFSFAGLWEEYEDDNGEMAHTFTIITTEANALVQPIHDRMPAILLPEHEQNWLNDTLSTDDLLQLLNPYDPEKMKTYSVSPRVNQVKNDSKDLIVHVPPADQHGNLTLFDF